MRSTTKTRRPKPMNHPLRKTLRFDEHVADAVEQMRRALARVRRVPVEKVDFSEAVRLLLVENVKAARVLAGQPEAWPSSRSVELPAELWDQLTDCRNRLSNSRGSIYTIMRKINFHENVTRDEVRDAFEAVQESKRAVERMEERLVVFVQEASAAAAAEAVAGRD